jgi:dimethylamine monooxygenase subunit A
MSFDFDAAVQAPFRMQPGLRRLAPGVWQLTPLQPGSRHQREKLAVLSAYAADALVAVPGFDAGPALEALCRHAQAEHPEAWSWQDGRAEARLLGTAVEHDGSVVQTRPGVFGLGDEVARCLGQLPPAWRQAGLLCLAFAEDFAVLDGTLGTLPWMAVCLPSHWAPVQKVGRRLAEVHAPVADNTLLVKASDSLTRLVTGPDRWERFVWGVTPHPRLHAHPARMDPDAWAFTPVERSWWRTEHQSFIPVDATDGGAAPEGTAPRQAVFAIRVEVQPLARAMTGRARAQALHDAIATMSPAVLDYRDLAGVRAPLLAWLAGLASTHPDP